ncbi:c-type cytochrome biogenesis protein CcsB [Thalassiella azotivora]
MTPPMTLAELSDALMYSAIVVYALAMLTYAAEAAIRTRTQQPTTAPAPQRASVPAGPLTAPASDHDTTATVTGVTGDSGRGRRTGHVAVRLTVLAFLLHAGAVAARGAAAGRAPWGNMYEFAAAGALAASAAYLVLLRREPVRDLGVWIVGVVTLTLGLAVTVLYTPAGDLVPALDSYWLVIHVAAAIISGGMFTVGAAAALLFLLRRRSDRRQARDGRAGGYAGHLPPAAMLERVAHAAHVFAFPIWTFAVIAGAIWAEDSWGRYWGWDPKETWAFITWVLYAAYLHAHSTAGWRGPKATAFAVAGYLAFLFNFFGVNIWITGLHSYAGV